MKKNTNSNGTMQRKAFAGKFVWSAKKAYDDVYKTEDKKKKPTQRQADTRKVKAMENISFEHSFSFFFCVSYFER